MMTTLQRSRGFGGLLPSILAIVAVQTACGGGAARAPARVPAPMAATADAEAALPGQPPTAGQPGPPPAPMSTPMSAQKSATALTPAPLPPTQQPAPKAAADARGAKNVGPSVRAPVIIYHGDMKMLTDEEAIPKRIDAIIDVAEGLGGHVVGRKDASVEVKVPSASFRDAMTRIDGLGGVTSRSIAADDVSEEFHDLEVRLANARATRARLQELLAKAGGIPDMLTVEHELERVAQEIDRIEGRLEFLRTRAAMSLISVALTPKPKPAAQIVATTTTTSASATPRTPDLPIAWIKDVGIDTLLTLRR